MLNIFHRKKEWEPTKDTYLVDFSAQELGTGDICNLLYYLYKKFGWIHITYIYKNVDGVLRFELHTLNKFQQNAFMKYYFKDRSPSQIEELCISLRSTKIERFISSIWDSGFVDYEVWKWKEVNQDECEEKES